MAPIFSAGVHFTLHDRTASHKQLSLAGRTRADFNGKTSRVPVRRIGLAMAEAEGRALEQHNPKQKTEK